jgi:ribosomal-protein-alanine N-acetyltransferase
MAATPTSQPPATAIVVTDKCYLRPLEQCDIATMAVTCNDPAIAYYMRNTFPSPYTLENAEFFVNLSMEASPTTQFAILALDGTHAGGIGLVPG